MIKKHVQIWWGSVEQEIKFLPLLGLLEFELVQASRSVYRKYSFLYDFYYYFMNIQEYPSIALSYSSKTNEEIIFDHPPILYL